LLYEGKPTIADLEIIDPYQAPKILGGKDTYLDVKARLQDGTLVIIEMRVLNQAGFEKRVLSDTAISYVLQRKAGEGYKSLLPVIALTITDFVLFPTVERPISRFVFKEREALLDYPMNDIELVFVELPKFHKRPDEAETLTDLWMAFFRHARALREVPPRMAHVPALRHAFEIANQAILSAEELEFIERQEAFIQDTRLTIEESREEGIQQGIIATARRMLPKLDDATISELTGLDIEQVRALRAESASKDEEAPA
jgi:predicted transposase/invertase (TIGR01784 family)